MYSEFDFGRRLSQLRERKGVSARDMSLSMGQNPGYINKVENGKAMPSMEVFFYICEFLAITPSDFFDEKKKEPWKLHQLTEECRFCRGSGTVFNYDYIAGEIRQKVISLFAQTIYNKVTVSSNKGILRALSGKNRCILDSIEKEFNGSIELKEIETSAGNYYEIAGEKV